MVANHIFVVLFRSLSVPDKVVYDGSLFSIFHTQFFNFCRSFHISQEGEVSSLRLDNTLMFFLCIFSLQEFIWCHRSWSIRYKFVMPSGVPLFLSLFCIVNIFVIVKIFFHLPYSGLAFSANILSGPNLSNNQKGRFDVGKTNFGIETFGPVILCYHLSMIIPPLPPISCCTCKLFQLVYGFCHRTILSFSMRLATVVKAWHGTS